VSSSGSKVVYAGVNWPGAADTMLPEGLQYNSVAGIVSLIKSLDMNVVRLTFAIEMIDDIYDDSPDQSLQATLIKALGEANGTTILGQILEQNPDFTSDMTRLEVLIGTELPVSTRLTLYDRSSTLWQLSSPSSRSGSTWTTMYRKHNGAAAPMMEMLGLVVRRSLPAL